VKQHRRRQRYPQNFLLCNNNEITACIADLFNSFCEEVYVVAFFKLMQQQERKDDGRGPRRRVTEKGRKGRDRKEKSVGEEGRKRRGGEASPHSIY